MNKFDKCESVGHKWIFEEDRDRCNVSEVAGFLQCEVCGATSDNIFSEATIDGELISSILYKEEQDELHAIDNERISAGLK